MVFRLCLSRRPVRVRDAKDPIDQMILRLRRANDKIKSRNAAIKRLKAKVELFAAMLADLEDGQPRRPDATAAVEVSRNRAGEGERAAREDRDGRRAARRLGQRSDPCGDDAPRLDAAKQART